MAPKNCESLCQQYAVRSISLPSRLHPNAIRIEAELNKLKQQEASISLSSITEPLSEEAIQSGLVGLAELYNCTHELMASSTTQRALLQHQNGVIVEESLDGSVELLDSCGAVRDLYFTVKQHVQELQSALRRKNGDSGVGGDVASYLCFRKRVKKEAAKRLRTLKHIESRIIVPSLDVNHNLATVIKMLREVTAVTISVLRTLLVFLSSPSSSRSKSSGWSLISKLMIMTKSAASHRGHTLNNIVECVDLGLTSLQGRIKNGENKAEAQIVRRQLQMLDSRIEGLEAGLECLFRQLVRHRVTLLNILTDH